MPIATGYVRGQSPSPRAAASDGTSVDWTMGTGDGMRGTHAANSGVGIATGQTYRWAIVADATAIFWVDFGGAIDGDGAMLKRVKSPARRPTRRQLSDEP